MMLDGIVENHTAAMLAPYLDHDGCATGNSGLDFIDPGELPRYVTALDQAGVQVHFHALGDRAVRNALNAVEAARAARPGSARETWIRHHLAHLQVVHPDDIPRFAALGATANLQMLWAMNEPQMTELTIPFLGATRATWQYPFAELAASGAHLAGGSDWPVSSPDPLLAIHVAVNRALRRPRRSLPAAPGDHRRTASPLTRRAPRGSTAWRPRPDQSGRLRREPRRHRRRPRTIPDAEICEASVTQTWVRGALA